jgi:hypothetical protein
MVLVLILVLTNTAKRYVQVWIITWVACQGQNRESIIKSTIASQILEVNPARKDTLLADKLLPSLYALTNNIEQKYASTHILTASAGTDIRSITQNPDFNATRTANR